MYIKLFIGLLLVCCYYSCTAPFSCVAKVTAHRWPTHSGGSLPSPAYSRQPIRLGCRSGGGARWVLIPAVLGEMPPPDTVTRRSDGKLPTAQPVPPLTRAAAPDSTNIGRSPAAEYWSSMGCRRVQVTATHLLM